ncbi:MAG: hypothetical protein ACI4XP_03015 [Acutalibacteraceae bacterium]
MSNSFKFSSTVIGISIAFATILTGCSSSTENNISSVISDSYDISNQNSETSVVQSSTEISQDTSQTVAVKAESEYSKYVTIGKYKGLNYTPYNTDVSDDDIQNKINSIILENADLVEIKSHSVSKGDIVTVDYEIFSDNKLLESYSKKNYSFVIGKDNFLYDGADKSVIGKEKGDKFTFELSVPENSELSDIAGKKITVNMKIDKILHQKIDEFDDEFTEKYTDGEYTSAEKYKEYLKKQLKEEFQQYAEKKKYSDIWQQVVDNCTIKGYDTEYYNSYYKQLQETTTYLADNYDMGYDEFIDKYYGTDLETYTKKNIAEEYIVNTIAFNENITVNGEEYEKFLQSYAKIHSYSSVDDMMKVYSDDILKYYCLREYVIKYIGSTAIANKTNDS